MNKRSCAFIIALLYPAYALSSGQSRRQKRTRRKQRSTFKLPEFNKEVTTREQLLWRIKQEEVLIPENSQAFENLAKLYTKLLDSPINNAKENDRWTGYRDKHATRKAIMKQIHLPELHISSKYASTQNLHNINTLLNLWKKLRNTYLNMSQHYRHFNQKVSILESASRQEEFELNRNDFEKVVQSHLNSPQEISKNDLIYLHNCAKHMFRTGADSVLNSSSAMKQLAKQIVHIQWQKLARKNKKIQIKPMPYTISSEEHAQLKIMTPIAALTSQKNLGPLSRATGLETLYNKLAHCSSDEEKRLALATAQYYGKRKKRALLEQKLNLIIKSDCINTLKLAQTTAQKLRNTYPNFHPKYAEYDEAAQRLALKAAYMNKNIQHINHLKKNALSPTIIQYADRLLDRLCFQNKLSYTIDNKKPYKEIHNATVDLLSTYDAKEKGFNHYLTKILRADLKQKIEEVQLDSQLSSKERYNHLLILIQQIISAYPEQHPKQKKYIHAQKTISCLKSIENYKSFILTNKDKPLDKTIAYALSKAYSHLLASCDNLAKLNSASQVAIHTCELGDIEKNALFYRHTIERYELYENLKNIEKENPLDHKGVIGILDKLINLPILSSQEKNDLIAKSKKHSDLILEKRYTNELRKQECASHINYAKCIELIKKLRSLSTLTLEQILLLEDKMYKYRIRLRN